MEHATCFHLLDESVKPKFIIKWIQKQLPRDAQKRFWQLKSLPINKKISVNFPYDIYYWYSERKIRCWLSSSSLLPRMRFQIWKTMLNENQQVLIQMQVKMGIELHSSLFILIFFVSHFFLLL